MPRGGGRGRGRARQRNNIESGRRSSPSTTTRRVNDCECALLSIISVVLVLLAVGGVLWWSPQDRFYDRYRTIYYKLVGPSQLNNTEQTLARRSLIMDTDGKQIQQMLSMMVLGVGDGSSGESQTDTPSVQTIQWMRVRDVHGVVYGSDGANHVLVSITLAPEQSDDTLSRWSLDDISREDLAQRLQNISNATTTLNSYGSLCFDTMVSNLAWTLAQPFYIHTSNLAVACMDAAFVQCVFSRAVGAIQSALDWQPFGSLRLFHNVTTPTIGRNNRNDVMFGSIPLPNAAQILAVTSFWWSGINNLVEWDQAYNTMTYQFGAVEQWRNYTHLVDLQNTATHELLHSLGMRDTYSNDCSESSCYGLANYRERKKRSLEIDDQVGLNSIYGGLPVVQNSASVCAVNTESLSETCRVRFAVDLAMNQNVPPNPPVPSPTPTLASTTTSRTTDLPQPTSRSAGVSMPTPTSKVPSPISHNNSSTESVPTFWASMFSVILVIVWCIHRS